MGQTTEVAVGVRTRSQRHLEQALKDIHAVLKEESTDTHSIFGGLCHKLPVLVRTCGLCQSLAFIEDKASKDDARGKAYKRLRSSIAVIVGTDASVLMSTVQKASLSDYIRKTRLLLNAWVYYKRFAVSILKVGSGQESEEN